jgi:hypothetical protein
MDFKKDALRLKEAIGKDTEAFIEVYEDLKVKYPDKKDLIIDIVEKELEERSRKIDAFLEYATKVLQQRKVAAQAV